MNIHTHHRLQSLERVGSWWPQQLLLGWLNLVLTAPVIYLFVGLPLILRQHGWSGTEIGMLQLAGLPAMLKFVLATPVDRWRLGQASYRNWTLVLGMAYVLALLWLGMYSLRDTPSGLLFLLTVTVCLLGTWVDVPINALAIQILPESERLRAGAIRALATSLAAIGGGGIMLILHARLGWAWPFVTLAIGVLSGLVLVPWLRPHRQPDDITLSPAPLVEQSKASLRDWIGYFRGAPHRIWAMLLVLYFPCIGAAWVYLKPLMLDMGFEQESIAWIAGVLGGLVAAISSLVAGHIARLIGATAALPLFAAVNLLVLLSLTVVVVSSVGQYALIAVAMALALAMGASAGLMFGLMMHHTRPGLAALDYGIQSSLFVASRTTAPLLAGVLLDRFGYVGMLEGLSLTLILVCLFAWYSRHRIYTTASIQGPASGRASG
ncbi:MFS transporter [Vreelandella alkaliphila]|uniref:MFS transporter n=1 Tax=Halomonas campaniensis TaxID=213554 RepID=A0A3D0KBM6_9GAMM|nr:MULTISPECIES: MFS transporter [unclassified Halomonas]HBS83460.1 MFS transporter [Halomonas campaniensis]HCA00864.1 MFS transporter [Halomonas campaniensis]